MRENRKTRSGRVVSDKMDKTIVVQVETRKAHPLYRRMIRRPKKYKAHDERNEASIGDLVRIIECRPISKDKHWELAEIVTRVKVAEVRPEEIGAETLAGPQERPA